ncbi:hypothetical protein CEUSTIGMA_g4395.t1 [Chlamydomonas eustigma]|uniref:Endonuclease/exonuclease/phosphatase domain-containing protein n=1 Tax=Chlamydomonas eustigma TaxID=1157962 RepID=A0A250X1K3_9CHLO|nr:hypothetical protein CEUSTIGMA_g4395.t1 [Chlamydomonas eustigma]|eukprot:GAX76948.1 hypothetical protein CEUSTIGMA_g4395.t1 [Chlamydomonas eustigma]
MQLWKVRRFIRPFCRMTTRKHRAVDQLVPTAHHEAPRGPFASTVLVRDHPADENLNVFITLLGKPQSLNRPRDEPLEKALARLRAKAVPPMSKKEMRRRKGSNHAVASGVSKTNGQAGRTDLHSEAGKQVTSSTEVLPSTVVLDSMESSMEGDEASSSNELPVALFHDAEQVRQVDVKTPNAEAWALGRVLKVGDQLFSVIYNPPTVDKVLLVKRAIVGHKVLAMHKVIFSDATATRYCWSRRRPVLAGSVVLLKGALGAAEETWEDLGCYDASYTPTPQDLGYQLRVECTPVRLMSTTDRSSNTNHQHLDASSSSTSVIDIQSTKQAIDAAADNKSIYPSQSWMAGEAVSAMTGAVEEGPSFNCGAVHLRAPQIMPAADRSQGRMRVLSYNILADQYAGSTYAEQVLFNYCPLQYLDPDYRKQLVVAELEHYNADVACLQEVDEKAFTEFFLPHMQLRGYDGRYTNKMGRVREGSATFWRTSRFSAVAVKDVFLRNVFKELSGTSSLHARWKPMLDASPELTLALQQKVTTVAQITLLAPVDVLNDDVDETLTRAEIAASTPCENNVPNTEPCFSQRALCVVNTHLFYHPYAPHIRTMHTSAILEEAADFMMKNTNFCVPRISDDSLNYSDRSESDGRSQESKQGLTGEQTSSHLEQQGQSSMKGRVLKPALLFCGDLNSDLNDGVPGVIQLLQSGRVSGDHWDWSQGASFKWGMEEEEGSPEQQAAAPKPPGGVLAQNAPAFAASNTVAEDAIESGTSVTANCEGDDAITIDVTGVDVDIPSISSIGGLRSADDLKTPFSNYTSGYKALLDYVWYDPQCLKVISSVKMPSEEALAGFIPSRGFPSDHLAVVYDLALKRDA